MEKRTPTRIFVSYAYYDEAQLAARLCADLQSNGFSCYLDRNRINLGASWTSEIEEAINSCDILLALLSEGSFRSEICRAEQLRALRHGKRVIPVYAQPRADRPLHLEHLSYCDLSDSSRYADVFQLLLAEMAEGAFVPLPVVHARTVVTAPALPPDFIARPEELDRLRRAVMAENPRQQLPIISVQGMGGVGKTILAQALCHDPIVQTAFPDGIIWVSIGRETQESLLQLREIGKALGDVVSAYDTPTASINRLRSVLQEKAALVVLDDVWDTQQIEPFRVQASRSRLVYTTRDRTIALAFGAQEIPVGVLTPEQAETLLSEWAGKPQPLFREIARRLGYLPLALKLAGARLREGIPASEWLERFRHASQMKLGRYSAGPRESLPACFDISLEQLPEKDRRLYYMLGIFPANTYVPASTVVKLWSGPGSATPESDSLDLLLELARKGLLEMTASRTLVVHDLLRDYILEKLDHGARIAHDVLLRAYNPDPRPDTWAALFDDGYIFRNLIYHLHLAGRTDEISILLSDYRWLQAKLRCTDVTALIADYRFSTDAGAQFIRAALQLSAHILARDRSQLATQLVGRLTSSAQSQSFPSVRALVESVERFQTGHWFRPLSGSFTPPGGPLQRTLAGHTAWVLGVAVDNAGRYLVTVAEDRVGKIWDLETGEEKGTLSGHFRGVFGCAVTPGGDQVVTVSGDQTIRIWELESCRQLRVLIGHEDAVTAVAVLPDGKHLLTGSKDCTARVWDLDSGAQLRVWTAHSSRINAVAVSPNGKVIVTAADVAKVWDLETGVLLRTLGVEPSPEIGPAHGSRINSIAIAPTGTEVVCASDDGSIRLWDLNSGALIRTLSEQADPVMALCISSDGRYVITGSNDCAARVLDINTGESLRNFSAHSGAIMALAITPDNRRLITASADQTANVWNLSVVDSPDEQSFWHKDCVRAIALTPDGAMTLTASADGTVKISETDTTRTVDTFTHPSEVQSVAVTPNGNIATTVCRGDPRLRFWDLKGLRLQETRELDGIRVLVLAVTDTKLITTSEDHVVSVFDLNTGFRLRKMRGGVTAPLADGIRALRALPDGSVRLWNIETGAPILTLEGHTRAVYAIAASANGKTAVTASHDRTIRVWDLEEARERCSLQSQSSVTTAVVVNADGDLAFTTSYDNTLRMWDLNTGTLRLTFYGGGPLLACAVCWKRSIIVVGELSGAVHFLHAEGGWPVPAPSVHPRSMCGRSA
jgi:WD40 repeat protein